MSNRRDFLRHGIFILLILTCAFGSNVRAGTPAPAAEAIKAAARGDADWLLDWIAKGGDPDQSDDRGWTPLLIASARGRATAVDVLLNNPIHKADASIRFAPSGALPIHLAGQSGDLDTAKFLLAARPTDINEAWLLNGHTLLLQAAFYGHTDLVKLALEKGANPSATTLGGLTAIDLGRQFDKHLLIETLEASPPSQEAKNTYYKVLLGRIRETVPPSEEEAQRRSDAAAAAIADAISKAGGSAEPVDALLDAAVGKLKGVNVNRLAGELRQPLIVLAVTGNNPGAHPESAANLRLEVVRALLDRGASPLVREKHPMGTQAIIRASAFGQLDTLRLLGSRITEDELAGALNEIPAVNGLTSLHDAVLRCGTAPAERLPDYLNQIRWEIASGARSDIEDFSGRTQRQYAEEIADPSRKQAVLAALNSGISTPQWNHPAIAVPQLDPAIKWYSDVFGFNPISKPTVVTSASGERWKIATSIFGDDISQVRFVRMRAPKSPSMQVIELFELQPAPPPAAPGKRKSGYIHACMVVGDPETVAARAAARGGKILSRAELSGITVIFCEDPNGNIIELASAPW